MRDQDRKASDDASRVVARRYFIRAAIYAAPAVASVVAVQHASAQASLCAQPQCAGGACGPGCGACLGC